MPPAGTSAAPGARRIGDTGGQEIGEGRRGLLGIGGGRHDTDPVSQVIQVQPTRGVVLARQILLASRDTGSLRQETGCGQWRDPVRRLGLPFR